MTATVEDNDSSEACGVVKIEVYEKAHGFNLNEDELPGPGFARRGGKGNDLFGVRYISDN